MATEATLGVHLREDLLLPSHRAPAHYGTAILILVPSMHPNVVRSDQNHFCEADFH